MNEPAPSGTDGSFVHTMRPSLTVGLRSGSGRKGLPKRPSDTGQRRQAAAIGSNLERVPAPQLQLFSLAHYGGLPQGCLSA